MQEQAAVVIVAAGSSQRMAGRDKLWTPLAGRITLARTIDAFAASPLIAQIVLVLNPARLEQARELCAHEGWPQVSVSGLVSGGQRRQDSVRAGLDYLAANVPETRWVMIHDGARPLVSNSLLEAGLQAAQAHQAAVAAVPVKDTIKQVENGIIQATPERSRLWAVQTPQVFAFSLIHQAHHNSLAEIEATDDAALLERLGYPVAIFPGSYTNLKITTQEDLLLAEALLRGLTDL
ncbi:MAG TPA: 2-C-methyl-D-erythritol 4-phosphate cytidylyltransferase [Ktedonobacteraceae bacterium]